MSFIISPFNSTPTDPYFASVLLLLKMEGSGTGAFIDSSSYARTVTKVGNIQYSTSIKPFGTSSGQFDGTTDLLTVPDSADWLFVNSDFTIECMAYFNSIAGSPVLVAQWGTTSKAWMVGVLASNNVIFRYTTDGSTQVNMTYAWTPSLSTWYHIAFVRSGTNLTLYIDGTQQGASQTLTTTSIFNSTNPLLVGSSLAAGGSGDLNGYEKSVRLTSVARYSGTFSPPTDNYPSS